jgi:putative FmdB family regulatory protein
MPTYGYRCKSCNNTFEIVQSIDEEPIKECPKCSGEVNKIFYPVGITFKGSGFHVNDYKSPKRISAEKKSSESNNGDSAKAPGNGDSGCTSCAKKV